MAESHPVTVGPNTPHPSRPPSQQSSSGPSILSSSTTATPPWAGGSASTGNPFIKRTYQEIIEEANSSNSSVLIQFKLTKVITNGVKPPSLTYADFGEFLFDVLKIDPNSCLEIDLSTGRYDTKELLLKAGTDTTAITTPHGPHVFKFHEITTNVMSNQVTKVVFKNVPISVPDEEILHLCCQYGTPTDGKVHKDSVTIGGATRYTITSSTRWVQVQLLPGKTFRNYYWLAGPLPGDVGRRITVLHPNQPRQCSWCFKYPPTSASTPLTSEHCRGGGDGKNCEKLKTPREKMSKYIETLKKEGYVSLRDQYLAPQADFPTLSGKEPLLEKVLAKVDSADQLDEEPEDEDHDNGDQTPLISPKTVAEVSSVSVVSPSLTQEGPGSKSGAPIVRRRQPKIEDALVSYICNSGDLSDDKVRKYAMHALEVQDVVLDEGGDPEKVSLASESDSLFLEQSKAAAGRSKEKKQRFSEVEKRVWAHLRDKKLQTEFKQRWGSEGGGKKEKARLHSQTSGAGENQSLTKNQRVNSPLKD